MKLDDRIVTNCLLALIALFLGVLAIRPLLHPAQVAAQTGLGPQVLMVPEVFSQNGSPLDQTKWTEGFTLLDSASGNIWSYPVSGPNAFTAPTLIGTLQQAGTPITAPAPNPQP